MARKDEMTAEIEPAPQPDWQQMFMDLQQQIAALQQAKPTEGQWMQALMERMLAIQQQQATALEEQSARTLPKENPNYVAVSVFLKPNGEPHAKDLKCDMYLNSIYLNKTPMTKAEVDAWNAIVPIDEVRVTKTDGSKALGRVMVKKTSTGAIERLTLELPMKKDDNPQHYPALDVLANQVAEQARMLATV
jgi:SOS-response transcriptional repressor LexA